MDTRALAERIIRKSDREHPADAVLRDELKAQHGLSRQQSARISKSVFACYRWRGWLAQTRPIREQINQAVELAGRFSRQPEQFSDAELVARAVPSWAPEEMEVTAAFARTLQAEPKLWLRARHGQGKALAARLGDCRPWGAGPLADALEYQGDQDLFRTEEFHAGEFELQDISSQAVGIICAPRPGESWWDACAGEGGKTLHLSDLMENKGLIWASDRAPWRLARLKRRTARAKVFNYRTAPWDGGPRLPTKTKFDGVLVDAPCSGTGTWQRNPHARWTTTREDLHELSELQKQLLRHAAGSVKPGGKLVYAVCSLARLETLAVAEAFAQECPEFEPLALLNPLAPASRPETRLYLWPQDAGGNGMFIAAWRKPATSGDNREATQPLNPS